MRELIRSISPPGVITNWKSRPGDKHERNGGRRLLDMSAVSVSDCTLRFDDLSSEQAGFDPRDLNNGMWKRF